VRADQAVDMRRLTVLAALATVLALPALAAADATVVSVAKLQARFRAETGGDRLVRDPRASWAGVTALVLRNGTSMSARARYGSFTVYVFSGRRLAEVERMLADVRTAEPIAPDARGVRWEAGSTLHGERYWSAKTLYGANVVLVWDTEGARRVTNAWTRVHRALGSSVR
jgi:hypothetical protein